MDLGYGKSNQNIGDTTEKVLLRTAAVQESVIENEINKYDILLDDDNAIEVLRKKRLFELQKQEQLRKVHIQNGHGMYTELYGTDVAKEFFTITKQSKNIIVHFYKSSSAHVCDIFHKHLQLLATKHIETKFIKINVESCLQHTVGTTTTTTNNGITFLVERLHVSIMPTLVLIQDNKTIHKIQGFTELGNNTNFTTNQLAYLLGMKYGIIQCTSEEEDVGSNNDTNESMFIHNNTKTSKFVSSTSSSRRSGDDRAISKTVGRYDHYKKNENRSNYYNDDDNAEE